MMHLQLDLLSERLELIDTDEQLEEYSGLWEEAYVCAIDAEWQPDRAPSATLVQLAVRTRSEEGVVILLDLLSLSRAASKAFLQALFRSKTVLKIGYGLANDLSAISTALGGQGGSCVAVVQPLVEMRDLTRQLRRSHPGCIPKTRGPGLSGLVDGVFGQPLDKRLQCSSWGKRPLSAEQKEYAALDAACLLGLLDFCVERCMPPARSSEDLAGRLQDCLHLGGCSAEGAGLCEGSVLTARDAWSYRLEISGGSAHVVRKNGQTEAVGSCGDGEEQTRNCPGHPKNIPWRSADGCSTSEPRFLADVAQEGLARQLRLYGIDTASAPNLSKGQRHLVHRFLVETAEREGRVILTCDRLFARRGLSDQTYLVTAQDKRMQLAEVLAAFAITVEETDLLSRCAKCNGDFIPRPLGLSELPPETAQQLPACVIEMHDDNFWVCASCKKAYWQGSQYTRSKQYLIAKLRNPQSAAQMR